MTVSPLDRWRELEQLLRKLVDLHGAMLTSLADKREAIRTAQLDRIEPLCVHEKKIVQQILETDRARQTLSAKLAAPPKGGVLTLTILAAAAPADIGARLRALGDSLRELVLRVKKESATVRQAAEALCQHIGGLMQTIHTAMSSARVYGRRGRIQTPQGGVVSAVDLRS